MIRAALIGFLVLLMPVAAVAEKRIALLIGNQGYNPAIGMLKNPHNDIARLGTALKQIGFEVFPVNDATLGELNRAVNAHIRRVSASGPGTIGFLYYSG